MHSVPARRPTRSELVVMAPSRRGLGRTGFRTPRITRWGRIGPQDRRFGTEGEVMPFVNVRLIEGRNRRPVTWVVIDEVKSGD